MHIFLMGKKIGRGKGGQLPSHSIRVPYIEHGRITWREDSKSAASTVFRVLAGCCRVVAQPVASPAAALAMAALCWPPTRSAAAHTAPHARCCSVLEAWIRAETAAAESRLWSADLLQRIYCDGRRFRARYRHREFKQNWSNKETWREMHACVFVAAKMMLMTTALAQLILGNMRF